MVLRLVATHAQEVAEQCAFSRCPSTKARCRRRTRDVVCYQHRNRSPRTESEAPGKPPSARNTNHGRRPPRRPRSNTVTAETPTSDVSRREIVEIARDVIDADWLAAVDGWAAEQASQALWTQVQREDGQDSICQQLNTLAQRIEDLVSASAAGARGLGASPLVQDFVAVIVAHATTPASAPLAELARQIRFAGIFLCTVAGRLDTCPCLQSLVEPVTEDTLRTALLSATHLRPDG